VLIRCRVHGLAGGRTDRCGCRCVSSCPTSGGNVFRRTGTDTVESPCGWVDVWTTSTIVWSSCRTAGTWTCELHQPTSHFRLHFRSPSQSAILMTSCRVTGVPSWCCWECSEARLSSAARSYWRTGKWPLHNQQFTVDALIHRPCMDNWFISSHYALVTSSYTWNKIISKLFQPSSTSVWNNFAWNYFKIISEAYYMQLLNISDMFNVAEIIWNNISGRNNFRRGYTWNKTLKLLSKLCQNNFISHVGTALRNKHIRAFTAQPCTYRCIVCNM